MNGDEIVPEREPIWPATSSVDRRPWVQFQVSMDFVVPHSPSCALYVHTYNTNPSNRFNRFSIRFASDLLQSSNHRNSILRFGNDQDHDGFVFVQIRRLGCIDSIELHKLPFGAHPSCRLSQWVQVTERCIYTAITHTSHKVVP